MPAGVAFSLAAYLLYSCCDAIIKGFGSSLSVFEIAFWTALFSFLPAIFTSLPPVAFLSPVSVVAASVDGDTVGWLDRDLLVDTDVIVALRALCTREQPTVSAHDALLSRGRQLD